jgi:hypothetical protein
LTGDLSTADLSSVATDLSSRDLQSPSDLGPSPSPTPTPTVFVRVANVLAGGAGAHLEAVDICVRPAGSGTAWSTYQPVLYGRGQVGGVPLGTVTNYIGVAAAAVDLIVVSAGLSSCPAATTYHGTAQAQPGFSTVAAAINDAAGRESDFYLVADENVVSPARTRLRLFTLVNNPPTSITLTAVEEPAANTAEPLPMPFGSVDYGTASAYVTLYPSPIPSPTPSPSPTPAPAFLGMRWDTTSSTDQWTVSVFTAAPASPVPYTMFFSAAPLICSDAATKVETTFAAACSAL